MIDRRMFLKGIIGVGITADYLPIPGITDSYNARNNYVSGLQETKLTLVVKVDEVIHYKETAEFDVCGRCIMNFEPVPVEVRFFIDDEDMSAPTPSDFREGDMFIMTGPVNLFAGMGNCIYMVAPEVKHIEHVLTAKEIDEIQRCFSNA